LCCVASLVLWSLSLSLSLSALCSLLSGQDKDKDKNKDKDLFHVNGMASESMQGMLQAPGIEVFNRQFVLHLQDPRPRGMFLPPLDGFRALH
jgi:hypothetical protein